MKQNSISIIGSQMDLGSFRKGVDMGPLAIRHAGLIRKIQEIGYKVRDYGDIMPMVATTEGDHKMRYEKEINDANRRLFEKVLEIYKEGSFPVILGGDHSIAAGSVSATAENYGPVGILWIDAHGDFNDESISPSGNIHGMPLSAVCGCGPDSLVSFTDARVDPHNVVIIGARDLDPPELVKLKEKGVRIYSINDVHTVGIKKILEEAIAIASDGTSGIHLSFDMDALDPDYAPGVGTPVLNGLTTREGFMICEAMFNSGKLLAIDIVETNPLLDNRNTTGRLAAELVLTCIGMTDY
ncbi:MAG: arginase [Lachnospiraceae bacterium]|nr:arginase [Lachnospiraceae bacterium]